MPTPKPADPSQGIVIPNMPPEFLGPTGKVFIHPDGQSWSTHINIVTGDVVPGSHTIVPMLVPGQKNIPNLIAGKPATPEQFRIAIDWARQAMKNNQLPFPIFDTPDDALMYEQQWHDATADRGRRFIAPYLTPTPTAARFPPNGR